MELSDVVRARRMVRSYDPDRPVAAAQLHALVDLARRAPSAGGSQGWDFVVLSGAEQTATFWAATTDPARDDPRPAASGSWLAGLRTAPALVVCWSRQEAYRERYARPDKATGTYAPADLDERWPVPYWHVDVGMAAMVLLLGAVDAGLGACFFAVPTARVPALREALGVPVDRTPVGVVSLGHPAGTSPDAAPRTGRPRLRGVGEVAHAGRFGVPLEDPGGS